MDPIHDVIARAGRRMLLSSWMRWSALLLTVLVALAVLARGTQKLAPVFDLPWAIVLISAIGIAALGGLLIAYLRRPAVTDIARTVDENAGLRESLSTALCVEQEDGAWSKAIVDDASHKAKRVVVRDAVPVQAPRTWWMPFAAALALLAVWWLPVHDMTGMLAKQQQRQADQAQVREVQTRVEEAEQSVNEILSRAGIELEEGEEATEDLFTADEMQRLQPEEMQRAAIKRLTKLNDTLEEQRNGEDGATFDALRDAMRRMETPEPGPATELSRAMARGDFEEASKQLEALREQIQSGDMSEEQKQQLESQLNQMAQAMEQMAQSREQLQEQLQAAGLSEQQAQQLATDPDALQQALEEQGMSQEQAQELAQQAQAQQRASDAASSMSQAMGQMAQGMQSGNEQQMGEGLDSMSGQLSQMEQMQQEMQSLEAAMGECQNQMAGMCENPGGGQGESFGDGSQWGPNGEFQQGETAMRQGSGSGQAGQGLGTGPDEQAVDFMLKKEKANVNTTDQGPVIASTLVYGSQVRGESRATFSDAVESAEAEASEAIETKRVPRELEDSVKRYFGHLKRESDEASGEVAPAEEATEPAPEPAEEPEGD